MKKNNLAEIKKMNIDALLGKVKATKKELVGLILDKNASKLTNLRMVKNKRKDLAQMLTILKQKHLLKELEEKQHA